MNMKIDCYLLHVQVLLIIPVRYARAKSLKVPEIALIQNMADRFFPERRTFPHNS